MRDGPWENLENKKIEKEKKKRKKEKQPPLLLLYCFV